MCLYFTALILMSMKPSTYERETAREGLDSYDCIGTGTIVNKSISVHLSIFPTWLLSHLYDRLVSPFCQRT